MSRKQKKPSRIPMWLWAVICAVLGLAVVAGIVVFFVKMDYFREGFDLNAIPTNITQPVDTQDEPEEDQQEDTTEEQIEEEPVTDKKICTGLALSQEQVTMDEEGERIFLTAAVTPEDCDDEILYTSTDETVVTVSESGIITAVGPGEAQIIISCGTFSEVCEVTCTFGEEEKPEEETQEQTEETTEDSQTEEETTQTETQQEQPVVAPAALSTEDFTLFYPGEETYLSVKNVPEGAAVSYVSSNAGVVTVTNDGKVTAVGNGQATITVTVGETTLTCIARCNFDSTTEGGAPAKPAYTGPFALNYTDITFQFVGEVLNLKLTDSTGAVVTGLSWVTANGSVCTVSDGKVTALGSGYTTVSTTYNGTTYSCIIRTSF